jgi:hypothetical protein
MYMLLSFFVFASLPVFAKCKEFDVQPPAFCAELRVTERLGVGGGKCYFKAAALELKETTPQFAEFPFTKQFSTGKGDLLFSAPAGLCEKLAKGSELNGAILKSCNDNRSFLALFPNRWLIFLNIKGAVYPDFIFDVNARIPYGPHKGEVLRCEIRK